MNLDLKEIKALIKILDETDVAELTIESDGSKIHIRKGSAFAPVASQPPAPAAAAAVQGPTVIETPTAAGAEPAARLGRAPADTHLDGNADTDKGDEYIKIVAPVVGTFYGASAPDAEPYVKVGDVVHAGQTLCIIEAMKLMNEIESEVPGRIAKILAENGQPVEYGQPLFLIEPL